jgi:DNA-directed RNA polymerase specialized sigma24 family protein
VKQSPITIANKLPIAYSAEELYDKYSPFLFSSITAIIANKQQAEKTLVEVFISLYNHLSDFNPKRNTFEVWLMNNARNTAIDNLCGTQKVYQCDANFKSLSLAEKTVFALFYFRTYTVKQIVDVLHLSAPVVEKLLQAAEAKAKKVL